jgi:DNA (cytosine-5)-methyltransferase 1
MVYYNEIEPFAVQWLRNLIAAGHIADGVVDSRPIQEVQPGDLIGFEQCHFFAGIGGWSYALRLAGVPDDFPVWTGSCPCQPFSGIGKGLGFKDERHLWPEFKRLIAKQKPSIVFGEQVATAKVWLDLVLSDLEDLNYSCGAANLPACSIGARHERQRLWFVADADETRWSNTEGVATTQAEANVRRPYGVAYRQETERIRGAFEPDSSWIIDGVFGEGNAVSAYGNAIVPQVAAEFIKAFFDAR